MRVLLTVLLVVVTGVPFVALLMVVPRRLLGLQIGLVRAAIAAVAGNVAYTVAGRTFIRSADKPLTLATLQIWLALLGAMAFLAVAEAAVPSGSGLRVVNWRRAWQRKRGRARRYG